VDAAGEVPLAVAVGRIMGSQSFANKSNVQHTTLVTFLLGRSKVLQYPLRFPALGSNFLGSKLDDDRINAVWLSAWVMWAANSGHADL
jgi:hypothetical protein